MFFTVARQNENYKTFFSKGIPNPPIQPNMIPDSINRIDFPGLGAYRFWNDASEHLFKIRKTKDMSVETAKEFAFHSVWGTAKENLGILEWMIGHHFQIRRMMGEQFKERNAKDKTFQPFKLITFGRICKLANASQTNLSGGKGQISRLATFSGKCKM